MQTLEFLYAREFKKIPFHPRKLEITAKKTILHGPRGSGKSHLIKEMLARREKGSFLYIDFDDLRVEPDEIAQMLGAFLKQHPIRLLVLENFGFFFDIPECEEVIVTTTEAASLPGFGNETLYPLDFEEFLSFEKGQRSAEAAFGHYADLGTFPVMLQSERGGEIETYQNLLKQWYYDPLELVMLKLFATRQGHSVTTFGLFNTLKESYRVSKDSFYAKTKRFVEEKTLFLVPRYGHPKAARKLYLIDHAMRRALSFEKDFIKRFENIVFLELMKREWEIAYTEQVDFYLPALKRGVVSLPFIPAAMIQKRLGRLYEGFAELGIKTVEVVTMGEEGRFSIGSICYEMIPFWRWALSLEDR